MTDLPERIYVGRWPHGGRAWRETPEQFHITKEYLRADTAIPHAEAAAMVAAAVAKAARTAVSSCDDGYYHEDIEQAVLALTPADASAAFDQAVREAVEAERASWEPVADALWQLLDDMGLDGHSVCSAAKRQAIDAYMDKVDGLFPNNLDVLPSAIRAPQETNE